MILLFSSSNTGALRDGATFFATKHQSLTPAHNALFISDQAGPFHRIVDNLGPETLPTEEEVRLAPGEAAIIIGHGGSRDAFEPTMLSEEGADVSREAAQLICLLIQANPQGNFEIFLAACSSAYSGKSNQTALITVLARACGGTLWNAMIQNNVRLFGYTADAALVRFPVDTVLANYAGVHIYGVRGDNHCGYDAHLTSRLLPISQPDRLRFVRFLLSKPMAPLDQVLQWTGNPSFDQAFPDLFRTMSPTQP